MRNVRRNLALSASVWTMGLASPACAATATGIGSAISAPVVNSTLTISNIGDVVGLGVSTTAPGFAKSAVTDVPSGAISQNGVATSASATLGMTNAGTLGVQALAQASRSSFGFATALASVATGIAQFGTAPTVAAVTLSNSGTLTVGVQAAAVSPGAWAKDEVGFGIYQAANGGTGASAALTNASGGTVAVTATAAASGGQAYSSSVAEVAQGISQNAFATTGPATVSLSNAGTLNVAVNASANGTSSLFADAYLNVGLVQNATADSGAASATLTNTGAITMSANATLTSSGPGYVFSGSNFAYATALGGIADGAYANGGDAAATLDNSGTIAISANATVQAGYFLDAYASAQALIDVTAGTAGGTAAATLTNSGSVALSANATASGVLELAQARLSDGLKMTATVSSGDANVVLNNTGMLSISATAARVSGFEGSARALASLLIDQETTTKVGDATTTLDNAGTIALTAQATTNTGGFQQAYASLSHALVEFASATQGNATVNIDNTGTFTLTADAQAQGNFYTSALAHIASGFRESVYATSGVAAANFANAGTLTITAAALVSANSGGAYNVAAHASAASALLLRASGAAGTYNVDLTNTGALTVQAVATVLEGPGSANYHYTVPADGIVDNGIFEYAHPYLTASGAPTTTGAAAVSLENSGTIWIGTTLSDTEASASAGGSYYRGNGSYGPGGVFGGVVQEAIAASADASAALTNQSGGSITISASTVAASNAPSGQNWYYNASAYAQAEVDGGLVQLAEGLGGSATASLTNAGTIGIGAKSVAAAGNGFAAATALVQYAIAQSALAAGSAPAVASATLSNSGTIALTATAIGMSNVQGNANAQVNSAVYQSVAAYGAGAIPALASVSNSGVLALNAYAQATGTQYAYPQAGINNGIVQNAYAQTADAGAVLDNSATLAFNATAVVNGFSGFGAAHITQAVLQSASADAGNATATIDNTGSLAVTAVAVGSTSEGETGWVVINRALSAEAIANGGGDATATLTNAGTLTVAANAGLTVAQSSLYAGVASYAQVVRAVDLTARGTTGTYGANLDNSGTLAISADVTGTVPVTSGATPYGNALAIGTINGGIVESAYPVQGSNYAYVTGGAAQLALSNSGTIAIEVVQTASGPSVEAGAGLYYYADSINAAIAQNAQTLGGSIAETIDNQSGATVLIAALGNGTAQGGQASAGAVIANGVVQTAGVAGGSAALALTNAGTLAIQATANVTGGAYNSANAVVSGGLIQAASNPAYGAVAPVSALTVALNNTGTIDLSSSANASNGGFADARAEGIDAIDQRATAYGQADSVAATLTNAGTIAVSVAAKAVSSQSANVYAYATGQTMVRQAAVNEVGAASASLDNTGVIALDATATATNTAPGAAYVTASSLFGVGYFGGGEFYQAVATYGTGAASNATLNNSGTIDFVSSASASGGAGTVTAIAGANTLYQNDGQIAQNVYAGAATATATLQNAGTIAFSASAEASGAGSVGARAELNQPVSQLAQAGSLSAAGMVSLTNSGSITGSLSALANQTAGSGSAVYASADAYAYAYGGVGQQVSGSGSATLTNSGTIAFDASAKAQGSRYASGTATNHGGVTQSGSSFIGPVALTLANSGTIATTATFAATGRFAEGVARAEAVEQDLSVANYVATAAASADLHNSGRIIAAADATIIGTTGARASDATATGVSQGGYGTTLSETVENADGGTIGASATLTVTAPAGLPTYIYDWPIVLLLPPDNYANAVGVWQAGTAVGTSATVSPHAALGLTNAGTIAVTATANDLLAASGGTAAANASGVAQQSLYAGAATTTLTNSGTISVAATVAAGAGVALASADATGALMAGGAVSGRITNTGTIVAAATITGDAATDIAAATAVKLRATGALSLAATNAGTLAAQASAPATGGAANAYGLNANGAGATVSVINSGVLQAVATAGSATATGLNVGGGASSGVLSLANGGTLVGKATAPQADGMATAAGVALSGEAAVLTGTNSGAIAATASGAMAQARGIDVTAGTTTMLAAPMVAAASSSPSAAVVVLALTNSGSIAGAAQSAAGSASAVGVQVDAAGGSLSGTLSNGGVISAQANGPIATATALALAGGSVSAAVTNSGTLTASAIGATAQAYGIRVTGGGVGAGTVTITNSGTITARDSADGGTTWTHGIAIDTTATPSPAVIDLNGRGTAAASIYGDIDVAATDTINVGNGITTLDGAVNGDGGLRGTLNVLAGGTLTLSTLPGGATPALAGGTNALIHVNAANIAGTLSILLPTNATANTAIIAANTATIANGATLMVTPQSANGLYQNNTQFTVIAANSVAGGFSNYVVANGSVLLSLSAASGCATGSICVNFVRSAFDAPLGAALTYNQYKVGSGLEAAYAPTATGASAALYAQLFKAPTVAAYTADLDQLSGAQYADYLQSLKVLGTSFDGLLIKAGSCALASDRTACRSESRGRIWGAFNYVNAVQDNDVLATGAHSNDYQIALGTDVSLGHNVALGLGGAYVWSTNRYDRYAGQVRAQGIQVGGYGVWSDGVFNAKGAFSFTGIDGYGQRAIAIGTGSDAITGTEHGKLNATVWSLTGQIGARYAYGALVAEPYVRADYTRAKLDAFKEDGVAGADLNVGGGRNERVATMVGVKWSGAFGNLSPVLDAAWRHLYGMPRAFETSAFAFAPSDAFSIASSAEARDQAVVDAGFGATLGGGISVKLSYQGAFGKQGRSNGGQLSIVVPLGHR